MDSTLTALAALAGGLALLLWGANVMVEHSVRLGRRMGMSPLVIGSTIIALGTSAPEFVVSFMAGLQGSPGIAVGNVLGSNISNLGLVLGVGILLTPFAVERRVIRVEYLVTLVVTVLATLFLWTHEGLARWEGWCLAGLMVLLFTVYITAELRKREPDTPEEDASQERLSFGQSLKPSNLKNALFGEASELSSAVHGLFAIGGLSLLVVGSQLAVDGAKFICTQFGVSEAVVGATIVALGTSLPELATTVAALPAKLVPPQDQPGSLGLSAQREVYLKELAALEMQELRAAGLWETGTAQQAYERLTAQHATLRNLAKQRAQERKNDVQALAL